MKILTLLIIFSTSVFANEKPCELQAKDKKNHYKISVRCFDQAQAEFEYKSAHAFGNTKIIGWQNMILSKIKKKDETIFRAIAGPLTRIKKVIALTYNADKDEIIIINEVHGDKEILIFNAARSGNIKPRLIEDKALISATALIYAQENIYLINGNKLEKVSVHANSLSKLEKKKPQFVEVSQSSDYQNAAQMIYKNESLYVLNSSSEKLFYLDLIAPENNTTFKLDELGLKSSKYMLLNNEKINVYNSETYLEFK